MRILLISEIKPDDTNSSAIILKRHLLQYGEYTKIIHESCEDVNRSRFVCFFLSIISRVSKTFKEIFIQSIEPIIISRAIEKALRTNKPDILLSLAHGRLGLHAWRVGKKLGVPTLTIFHDWWPEMMKSYRKGRDLVVRGVERDFENAQKYSDLSLAICPEMAKQLVYSKNIEVLYPIPDKDIQPRKSFCPMDTLRVVYTGSLWNPYGKMLMNLESKIQGDPSITLKIHGDPKYIPTPRRDALIDNGILEDYLSVEAYKRRVTDEADVLLAVMGGDSEGEIRMATSFPSKVANYFQTGNIVLLWALSGSSLNQFCHDYCYRWFVESSNPADVVSMLKRLLADQDVMKQARSDAMRIRDKVFEPLKIQQQFDMALQRAIANYRSR